MLVRSIHLPGSMLLLPFGASAQAQTLCEPTPVPAQSQVYMAPNAPPPPRVETIPPPLEAARDVLASGPLDVDGASWSWAPGQYVERPAPRRCGNPAIGISSRRAVTCGWTAVGRADKRRLACRVP